MKIYFGGGSPLNGSVVFRVRPPQNPLQSYGIFLGARDGGAPRVTVDMEMKEVNQVIHEFQNLKDMILRDLHTEKLPEEGVSK